MRNFSKYLIGLATLSMVSCADWYTTHQLPEPGTAITTQEVFTYTLTDKDYDTISRNPAIIAYAHEIDNTDTTLVAEDSVIYKALVRLGGTHCFESDEHAGYFLPIFLKENFLGASMPDNEGSTFKVTYNVFNQMPAYLKAFDNMQEYTLRAGDYAEFGSNNNWLTKEHLTISNFSSLMADNFEDAQTNEKYIIWYNYNNAQQQECTILNKTESFEWEFFSIEDVELFVVGNDFYQSIDADYATKPATQLPIYLKTALQIGRASCRERV